MSRYIYWLLAAAFAGQLLTETGDGLLAENADPLIME